MYFPQVSASNVLDIVSTIASFTSLCSCSHKRRNMSVDTNDENESNEVVELFEELAYKCLMTIDQNAEVLMMSEDWLLLTEKMVEFIIKRDTLSISSEVSVVKAINRWCTNICQSRGVMPTLVMKVKVTTVDQS